MIVYNSASSQYLVTWRGDDNTPPLVNEEFEVFGQRLADLPPPGGGGPPGAGPSSDTVAPRFLSLGLTPRRFAAFRSGPSIRGARTLGTRVTYGLTEAAVTTFRVQRVLPGRPRCKRYRTLRGRFLHTGAAGSNRFRFRGRLAGRSLRPGGYRLVATATDAAGNRSTPASTAVRDHPLELGPWTHLGAIWMLCSTEPLAS